MALDFGAIEAWDGEGPLITSTDFPPPSMDPSGTAEWDFNPRGILDSVLSVANAASGAALAWKAQQNSISDQIADRNQAALLKTLQIDLARTQAVGAVDIAKVQQQTELAKAQAAYRVAAGTASPLQVLTAPSRDNLMLLLAAAGVVIAFMQWKGK